MKSHPATIFSITFLFSFFFSVAQTKQEPIDRIAKKLKSKDYVGLTLQAFYKDFKGLVKEPVWSDEPPGKLRGGYFRLKNTNTDFLKIYFKVIPDSVRFNEDRNWTFKSIEKSSITQIVLLKGDSTILKFPQ